MTQTHCLQGKDLGSWRSDDDSRTICPDRTTLILTWYKWARCWWIGDEEPEEAGREVKERWIWVFVGMTFPNKTQSAVVTCVVAFCDQIYIIDGLGRLKGWTKMNKRWTKDEQLCKICDFSADKPHWRRPSPVGASCKELSMLGCNFAEDSIWLLMLVVTRHNRRIVTLGHVLLLLFALHPVWKQNPFSLHRTLHRNIAFTKRCVQVQQSAESTNTRNWKLKVGNAFRRVSQACSWN